MVSDLFPNPQPHNQLLNYSLFFGEPLKCNNCFEIY